MSPRRVRLGLEAGRGLETEHSAIQKLSTGPGENHDVEGTLDPGESGPSSYLRAWIRKGLPTASHFFLRLCACFSGDISSDSSSSPSRTLSRA